MFKNSKPKVIGNQRQNKWLWFFNCPEHLCDTGPYYRWSVAVKQACCCYYLGHHEIRCGR